MKNNNLLREKAASYKIAINNSSIAVKNVYINPDTIYHFPLQFNQATGSHASYAINIPPDVYHREVVLDRKDTTNGWGSLITPFGNFTNCLKLVSTITQIDSLSINGTPAGGYDTSVSREYKWFDPSARYPVLYIKQNKIGNNFITQSIEYVDVQQFYQPLALFAYYPAAPDMGDTVIFQNLSANAIAYKWYFSDPVSGGADSSTDINPQHIFVNPGTYQVKLITYNGPLTDSISSPVIVNPKNLTYTFSGSGNWSDAANWSNNMVPPSRLPSGNSIVIDPPTGGECLLDVIQHIAGGASLTVQAGIKFTINGFLKIQ